MNTNNDTGTILIYINDELESDSLTSNRKLYLSLLKKLHSLDVEIYKIRTGSIPAQYISIDAIVKNFLTCWTEYGCLIPP